MQVFLFRPKTPFPFFFFFIVNYKKSIKQGTRSGFFILMATACDLVLDTDEGTTPIFWKMFFKFPQNWTKFTKMLKIHWFNQNSKFLVYLPKKIFTNEAPVQHGRRPSCGLFRFAQAKDNNILPVWCLSRRTLCSGVALCCRCDMKMANGSWTTWENIIDICWRTSNDHGHSRSSISWFVNVPV